MNKPLKEVTMAQLVAEKAEEKKQYLHRQAAYEKYKLIREQATLAALTGAVVSKQDAKQIAERAVHIGTEIAELLREEETR